MSEAIDTTAAAAERATPGPGPTEPPEAPGMTSHNGTTRSAAHSRIGGAYSIVWEDPPPAQRYSRWRQVLDAVRERPGEWARVYGPVSKASANSRASNLRSGRISGVDPDEWEFRHGAIDGQGFIWARFLGGGIVADEE